MTERQLYHAAGFDITPCFDHMAWDELADVLDAITRLHGADWGIETDTAAECGWGATARITPRPNQRGVSDRSLVAYVGGGATPNEVVRRAVRDVIRFYAHDVVAPPRQKRS